MASPPPKKPRLSPSPAITTPTIPTGTSISQSAAEAAVGITEYVNPTLPAWSGVLKQRYSDFLVNEVDEHGVVVHLKSTRAPSTTSQQEPKKDTSVNAIKPTTEETLVPVVVEEKTALEQLTAFVPADTAAAIIALSKTAPGSNDSITTPPIASKDLRSAFHGVIRTLFSSRLVTETSVAADPPSIVITRSNPATQAGERRRSKRGGKNHRNASWADLGGEYCHFTLYKENRDTMEVLNLLGRLLKLRGGNKSFSFAGTKDRRAVTSQRCAAHLVKAERLAGLNTGGDGGLRGARLGDFEYKPHGLSLGDLCGNEFVITLRQAESLSPGVALEDAVKMCVETVKRSGFANYYGLQRFGSFDVSTSDVGVYLLRGDWRGAVEKILSYNPALCSPSSSSEDDKFSRDDRERAAACEIYFTTYDFAKASSRMPRKYVAESAILRCLSERGNPGDGKGKGLDYLGAIQAIPRGLKTMYAHAYQSLIWNHVVSARLRISSTGVLPGDLIFAAAPQTEVEAEVDQHGELVISAGGAEEDDGIRRARALSAEEANNGKYTIADIVLPTPGWDIIYPENPALMEVYRSVMQKDGLNPMDMKRSVRDWSLTGSYRKVMSGFVDRECSYEVKRCRVGEQVVETDLETIEEAQTGEKRKRGLAAAKMEKEDGEEKEEEETVVVLRMRLSTSCYATMALRELMKGGVKAYKPEFGR
ncbi:pseudouridine synthase [Trichophaea hybrida]|nr:pseudouridine synthase [Trichophaea hybrida]